jgi:hypothetical protein
MTTKSGVNGDSLHSLLVLGRPLVTRAGLTAVHRGNGLGVPLELRNSEVLEQVLVTSIAHSSNPRKLITTKGSVELGDGLGEEIDAIGWGTGPSLLVLTEMSWLIWEARFCGLFEGFWVVCAVGPGEDEGRSQIRDCGTGRIPLEKTWCEEVQVQSTT